MEPSDDQELAALAINVAAATRLQEGELGIVRVMVAFRDLGPASTRIVALAVGLPLPVVAAIAGELRHRGVLSTERPSHLTQRGLSLLSDEPLPVPLRTACDCCAGRGFVVPGRIEELEDELARILERAPQADAALDQMHSTLKTKLRRVSCLLNWQVLPCDALLLVGDDDFLSPTIALVESRLGVKLARRLAVVDTARPVLDFVGREVGLLGGSVELSEHDLRGPLPGHLVSSFDLVMTDPPYTPSGSALFLNRAVSALRPGPGRHIALSYPRKGPDELTQLSDSMRSLGLTMTDRLAQLNVYEGGATINGVSDLWLLSSTAPPTAPLDRWSDDAIYTAQARSQPRTYVCRACKSRWLVGPSEEWTTIEALKTAGCPKCGAHRLRPLQLAVHKTPGP